jgi:hypothetical protein
VPHIVKSFLDRRVHLLFGNALDFVCTAIDERLQL